MDLFQGVDQWFWYLEDLYMVQEFNFIYVFWDIGFQEVWFIVIYLLGCQDIVVQVVDIQFKAIFFLFNVFMFNDDGLNDVYKGKGFMDGMKFFELNIWNCWGENVFLMDDL